MLSKLAEACSGQVARGSINSLNLLQAGVKPEGMRKRHKASMSVAAKEKRAEAKRAEVHVTHQIALSGDADGEPKSAKVMSDAERSRKYRLGPKYKQKVATMAYKKKQAAYNKAYYETDKASLSVAAKEKRAEAKRAEVYVTHQIAQSGDGDTFYCTRCAARGCSCSGQVVRGSMNS